MNWQALVSALFLAVQFGASRCEVEIFFRSGCLDKQAWCPRMKDYCETGPEVMYPICPLTCGLCPGADKVQPPGTGCTGVRVCDHECEIVGDAEICTCRPGYRLLPDRFHCQDIDECARENVCMNASAPDCVNTEGSYECVKAKDKCKPGYFNYLEREECCKLTEGTCGRNSANGGIQIGGPDSMVVRWPWMSLVVISSENYCGGILVTERWVLVSAHCLRNAGPEEVHAYFGIINSKKNVGIKDYSQGRRVNKIAIHPKYNYPDYDVAIIRVTKNVNLTNYVSAICLPHKELPTAGVKCWATSYRQSMERGQIVHTLKQDSLLITDNVQCKRAGEDIRMDQYMMCGVYDDNTGEDSCENATDGPVVCQSCASCDWFVAGLSFAGCPTQKTHEMFTTIAGHEDWLRKAIGLGRHLPPASSECETFGRKIKPAKWLKWSTWGECSRTCGPGVSTRRRTCENGQPGSDGCPGKGEEQRNCEVKSCAGWSDFGDWSECTRTCGGGRQTRRRKCVGGKEGHPVCSGQNKESQRCNTQHCPKWSKWDKWQRCSVTCGRGRQITQRRCLNGDIGDDGCRGKHRKSRSCGRGRCPQWSSWSSWSQCSQSCGEGTRKTSRECTLGRRAAKGCIGNATIGKSCKIKDCQGCTQWSRWSSCSATCGNGTEYRQRSCSVRGNSRREVEEKRKCAKQKCVASWDEWSGWSNCTEPCGGGVRTRTRKCINGNVGFVGCRGDRAETRACNEFMCPPEKEWSEWAPWGECDVTCGQGKRRRERDCLLLGSSCNGPPFEEMNCGAECEREICGQFQDASPSCAQSVAWCTLDPFFLVGRCDLTCCLQQVRFAYTEWSSWSFCSATCGKGRRTRTRNCRNPSACLRFRAPLEETLPCNTMRCSARTLSQCSATCGGGTRIVKGAVKACNTQRCHAVLSEWGEWSDCAVTCGPGNRKRTRTCLGGPYGCRGNLEEAEDCSLPECNGNWTDWEPWGPCSVACGIGKIQRSRACLSAECAGSSVQDEVCVTFDCPVGDGDCADLSTMQSLCPLLTTYCGNGFMGYYCRKSCNLC